MSPAAGNMEVNAPPDEASAAIASAKSAAANAASSERQKQRFVLRERNLQTWEKGPSLPSGPLDSSMKKNTGFVKKVRQGLGADVKVQLIKEAATLNLDKYIEELTQAVPEGLSKCNTAKDCMAAAEVSPIHLASPPRAFTLAEPVCETSRRSWQSCMVALHQRCLHSLSPEAL